ncbi:MAG: L-lactate permease, partial [Intestinibacter bartlettii]|nr:L-lactate permease [Intestinibacter bartlettii]
AGFGVPIAICALLLAQLGFKPLQAAMLCLIANAASGAFGAIGIPVGIVNTLHLPGHVEAMSVSQVSTLTLAIINFIIPFLLIFIIDGFKGIKETLPQILVASITYTVLQGLITVFVGPELADIIPPLVTMGVLAVFSKKFQPKNIFRIQKDVKPEAVTPHSGKEILYAWSPFIILTVIVMIWSATFFKNLFAPKDMTKDYLSEAGYGALMGLLHNYEVINPITNNSIDGFERLVPGFEAPVCIVTSLGHTYETPSRNRSVLVGLIRDAKKPKSLRFELRSPNPLSNTYLVMAACYQAMLDGIKFAAKSGLDTKALEKELSKDIGEEGLYLEKDRRYRDENNVFEYYNDEERNERFGMPPATVYENMLNLEKYKEKLECLKDGNVFTDSIIESFKYGSLDKWKKELRHRIIHDDIEVLRGYVKLHNKENMDALDEVNWNKISDIKFN